MNKIGWILLFIALISSFGMNFTDNNTIVGLSIAVGFTSLYCITKWGLK